MWQDAKNAVAESSPTSAVYIGTDSIRYKKKNEKTGRKEWYARYATVVVVHKDAMHGCKIFYNTDVQRDYGEGVEGLRSRLLNEVNYAIQAAVEITEVLGDRHLEVHLDLNNDPMHKSNVAVKEAVGWVMGMGFQPKIKPDGWAATHAADHCARSKSFAVR